MKTDRLTQALLALIALALFLNALNPWLRPAPALAQAPPADLPMMEVHLRNIDSYLSGTGLGDLSASLEAIESDVAVIRRAICGIVDVC